MNAMWWVMFPVLSLTGTYLAATGSALAIYLLTGWEWLSWSMWRVPQGEAAQWAFGYFVGAVVFGGISIMLWRGRRPRQIDGLIERLMEKRPGFFKFDKD